MKKRFIEALDSEELKNDTDLRKRLFIIPLFRRYINFLMFFNFNFFRLQNLVGIELKPYVLNTFIFDPELNIYYLNEPLKIADLEELYPLIKYTHRISFEVLQN